eukprot:TRINITY_DN8296_c0_g1_i1.p1 TRINITY_DN8296_c0_g1~~TRINITY_DN8296_c0_g1_i1.p1  ORF type:complete len:399 (-),score=47.45 TRINITY_DN8296_c0_g1_i1:19-1215(-)
MPVPVMLGRRRACFLSRRLRTCSWRQGIACKWPSWTSQSRRPGCRDCLQVAIVDFSITAAGLQDVLLHCAAAQCSAPSPSPTAGGESRTETTRRTSLWMEFTVARPLRNPRLPRACRWSIDRSCRRSLRWSLPRSSPFPPDLAAALAAAADEADQTVTHLQSLPVASDAANTHGARASDAGPPGSDRSGHVIVHGLFLEGCRWEASRSELTEATAASSGPERCPPLRFVAASEVLADAVTAAAGAPVATTTSPKLPSQPFLRMRTSTAPTRRSCMGPLLRVQTHTTEPVLPSEEPRGPRRPSDALGPGRGRMRSRKSEYRSSAAVTSSASPTRPSDKEATPAPPARMHFYRCPVYLLPTRCYENTAAASEQCVLHVSLASTMTQSHWVRRGAAAVTQA